MEGPKYEGPQKQRRTFGAHVDGVAQGGAPLAARDDFELVISVKSFGTRKTKPRQSAGAKFFHGAAELYERIAAG